ncbi:sensor domain-containing diguanylate cyclase [Coprobacillus sp. AM23-9LB]|nr:sensor domain-containing diguanylate cyclase [Coprobacillus sp. AM23-9LB]RHN85706.1 sensor domain-containing diguanylate cyclase [Coprobacillus sp. AM23-2]
MNMQSLKELIQKESKKITLFIIFFLMIIVTFFNCITAKKEANYTAQTTFYHIEQILNENQKDLNKQKKEYRQTCIDNAQAVAYSLQENPDALYNIDELKKIAQYVEVDEIHIFNKQGVIISGTHPEYYGYSFDSGKQLSFFKPLLSNQNLQLTQKIMENTASHIKMQYSALWSENKEFIVQVGMNHENASKSTKKNQLSYLFKLFRVNNEAQYYAINSKNHKIVGTTHHHIGDVASSIGLKDTQIKEAKNGFFTEIDGQLSYCVSKKIKNNYIYCIIPVRVLFKEVPKNCLEMIVCLIIISILFRLLIIKYIRVYVIDSINQINHQLSKISKGQLDDEVSINNSLEFQKLSHYINEMKQSLLVNNKKMDYILTQTNQLIGFYEYNQKLNTLYLSDGFKEIFSLNSQQCTQFKEDINDFIDFLNKINTHQVEKDIYYLPQMKRYIQINDRKDQDITLGVMIDITTSYIKRKKIEIERDVDELTQIYNRNGLKIKINKLLEDKNIAQYALIFIDLDGLKQVNDVYGHYCGDLYLKQMTNVLKTISGEKCLVGRLGGDEFIAFFHHYDSMEKLNNDINQLNEIRDQIVLLADDHSVNLAFSYGVCYGTESTDLQRMIEIADYKMYENKRKRKGR